MRKHISAVAIASGVAAALAGCPPPAVAPPVRPLASPDSMPAGPLRNEPAATHGQGSLEGPGAGPELPASGVSSLPPWALPQARAGAVPARPDGSASEPDAEVRVEKVGRLSVEIKPKAASRDARTRTGRRSQEAAFEAVEIRFSSLGLAKTVRVGREAFEAGKARVLFSSLPLGPGVVEGLVLGAGGKVLDRDSRSVSLDPDVVPKVTLELSVPEPTADFMVEVEAPRPSYQATPGVTLIGGGPAIPGSPSPTPGFEQRLQPGLRLVGYNLDPFEKNSPVPIPAADSKPVYSVISPEISYWWGSGPVAGTMLKTHWFLRWTGFLKFPQPGVRYWLGWNAGHEWRASMGARILVDGQPVVSNLNNTLYDRGDGWVKVGDAQCLSLVVEAGHSDFEEAGLQVQWMTPGMTAPALITRDYLFHLPS